MLTDTELSAIRARAEAAEKLFNRFKNLTISVADIPALLAHIEKLRESLAKAETDKAALAEALEEMVAVAELICGWGNAPVSANGPLIKARAVLSRVKGEA